MLRHLDHVNLIDMMMVRNYDDFWKKIFGEENFPRGKNLRIGGNCLVPSAAVQTESVCWTCVEGRAQIHRRHSLWVSWRLSSWRPSPGRCSGSHRLAVESSHELGSLLAALLHAVHLQQHHIIITTQCVTFCGSKAQWLSHLEFKLDDPGSIPGSRHYSIG